MVGPDFLGFITLLVVAVVVAIILSLGFNLSLGDGTGAWLEAIIVNYVGAWFSPILIGAGWFGISYAGVSIIPAIIGSAALHVLYKQLKEASTASQDQTAAV